MFAPETQKLEHETVMKMVACLALSHAQNKSVFSVDSQHCVDLDTFDTHSLRHSIINIGQDNNADN